MTGRDWPRVHRTITEAFRDHYDVHPVPLATFQLRFDHETTDLGQWRLVFDGDDLVGVGISSNRYAAAGMGYVDTLAVLRSARGRGIGTYLLRRSFLDDQARGMSGTALHCDAANLTGATRLYESVGMATDQHYDAWRARLVGG
jgi:GNAT superfamily N-acetyltransferase